MTKHVKKIRRKFADNVKAIGSVEPNSRMIVYDTPTNPPARRGTSSPNTGAVWNRTRKLDSPRYRSGYSNQVPVAKSVVRRSPRLTAQHCWICSSFFTMLAPCW